MQSGRGPGLIGMFMALVVMLGFGLLFLFAFDDGLQGASQSIESVIAQQKREIEALLQGIASSEKVLARGEGLSALEKECSALKRENQDREANLNGLRNDITLSNNAIAAIEQEFESYKNQYRVVVRSNAKGRTMAELKTRKGEVYANVVIREVTAIGIQIRHEGGLRRIHFEELPDEMQQQFQFDPDQKAAAVASEAAVRKEHESAVTASDVATSQKATAQKIKDAEDLRVKTMRAIAIKESQLKALSEEITHIENALPMEDRKKLGRAPIMRVELAAKKHNRAELQAQINQLQNSL